MEVQTTTVFILERISGIDLIEITPVIKLSLTKSVNSNNKTLNNSKRVEGDIISRGLFVLISLYISTE